MKLEFQGLKAFIMQRVTSGLKSRPPKICLKSDFPDKFLTRTVSDFALRFHPAREKIPCLNRHFELSRMIFIR